MSGSEIKGRLIKLFGCKNLIQLMGVHGESSIAGELGTFRMAPSQPELEERCRLVLEHLERIKPGSVTLAEAGMGLPHRIDFAHQWGRRTVSAKFTLHCMPGVGIVLRTPMCMEAKGMHLRAPTPKIALALEDTLGDSFFGEDMHDIITEKFEWTNEADEPKVYGFGQGASDDDQMFQMAFVDEGPGPSNKHLRYICWTVAELACFLDHLLHTYLWDSVCAAR